MRTALDCPFSPGADTIPQVWAGRTAQLSDWRDVVRPRRVAGLPERGRTILGEAGLGKSALVRRIARDAAASGDWVTPQLRVPSGSDPLMILARALLSLADQAGLPSSREKRIGDQLRRVETVAAGGISVTLHGQPGPEPFTAMADLLVQIGQAALRQGDTAVLIHLDEVQNINDADALSQLLIVFGDALAHEIAATAPGGMEFIRSLPIAVYLTGLPDFAEAAGADKGATFTRRFRTTILAPLDDEDLASALQPFVTDGWPVPDDEGGIGRVRMTPDARDAILRACCGEPFLFQLAGEQAWYADGSDVITRDHVLAGWQIARPEAAAHVERILQRLPGREREFLEAMSGLAPEDRTLTRIAAEMGYPRASNAGPTSQRLDSMRGIIARGKPYAFRHRAVEAYLTTGWPDLT
ncbi:ATP-binding protein [Acidipropionibacterium thoenii]|uniref:ATP-binding protein n=1 Tax=Acidipropionibacterium thoenii TaxID=1751 RepID=UPI0003FE2A0A|nr:ATP-binding protein [Acidipropionibacterium thoenii]